MILEKNPFFSFIFTPKISLFFSREFEFLFTLFHFGSWKRCEFLKKKLILFYFKFPLWVLGKIFRSGEFLWISSRSLPFHVGNSSFFFPFFSFFSLVFSGERKTKKESKTVYVLVGESSKTIKDELFPRWSFRARVWFHHISQRP